VLTIMGRGLSDLQRAVLLLAYRKRREREKQLAALEEGSHKWGVLTRGGGSVDLYFAEFLREHFGFEVHAIWWDPERDGFRRPHMGNNFSMQRTGERRYRTAQASLSRAVKRLEQRGLVRRWHISGFWGPKGAAVLDLTDAGLEVARREAEH
jgi:hypothetical protein